MSSRQSKPRILAILVIVGAAISFGIWWFGQKEPPSLPTPDTNEDARLRKLVVGTWTDNYEGKRTMTISPDGSATMLVVLEGLNAIMGSRLRFDMEWSIDDGRLKKRTIGGEPSGRVNFILKTMGDRVDEPILELTEKRLLLLDGDGETTYDWSRVE